MSLTVYDLPLDWTPDINFINSPQNINYLAWRIGTNEKRSRGLWLIEPVIDSPEPLENLLPDEADYATADFIDDTTKYGQNRSVQQKKTIDQVEASFLEEVANATLAVTEGTR